MSSSTVSEPKTAIVSRYDAFVWLMESIGKGVPVHNEQGEQIHVLPFSASYMRLAEEWNWDRHTVQQFLDELTGLSVISRQRKYGAQNEAYKCG